MDIRKLVSEAFLMAIIESVRREGPEKAVEWIERVADDLGEKEGPGLEGDPRGGVNCLYICPFANMLQEFLNWYGGMPAEFAELLNCSQLNKKFAASNVFCIFHYTILAKRAELAGRNAVHLASNANAECKAAYNEDAIEKAGMTKEEIDEMLKKTVCIFQFE